MSTARSKCIAEANRLIEYNEEQVLKTSQETDERAEGGPKYVFEKIYLLIQTLYDSKNIKPKNVPYSRQGKLFPLICEYYRSENIPVDTSTASPWYQKFRDAYLIWESLEARRSQSENAEDIKPTKADMVIYGNAVGMALERSIKEAKNAVIIAPYLDILWQHRAAEMREIYIEADIYEGKDGEAEPIVETPSKPKRRSFEAAYKKISAYRQARESARRLAKGATPHQLTVEFDRFFTDKKSGFAVLVAGPGVGKSALMAQLSLQSRPDSLTVPYFFRFEYNNRVSETREALYSYLNTVIAARYQLEADKNPNTPEITFCNLLLQASQQGLISNDKRLYIFIDGIDEMDADFDYRDTNPLKLPSYLEEGVFITYSVRASTQAEKAWRPSHKQYRIFELSGSVSEHVQSVKNYIRSVCEDRNHDYITGFNGDELGTGPEDHQATFIDTLARNANHNFMILQAVLNDKDYWNSGKADINKITGNLDDYYAGHLKRMQDNQSFSRVARVPYLFGIGDRISEKFFFRFSDNTQTDDQDNAVQTALSNWLSQGLIEPHYVSNDRWFSAYHKTFREYLRHEAQNAGASPEFWKPLARGVKDAYFNEPLTAKHMRLNSSLDHWSEWITVHVHLAVKTLDYEWLEALLTDYQTWQIACFADHRATGIFVPLSPLVPRPEQLQDFQDLFERVATLVKSWTKGGYGHDTFGHLSRFSGKKKSERDRQHSPGDKRNSTFATLSFEDLMDAANEVRGGSGGGRPENTYVNLFDYFIEEQLRDD